MSEFKPEISADVQKLESIIDPYLGKPIGDELPQVSTPNEVILNVVHEITDKSLELLSAELHEQTDPAYQ